MNGFSLLELEFTQLSFKRFIVHVNGLINSGKGGYYCFVNTRTLRLAQLNNEYHRVLSGSLLNFPDGQPLIWLGNKLKESNFNRISGPELMRKFLFDELSQKMNHFFLGDTEETLLALRNKYESNTKVSGHFSPPFVDFEELDVDLIANKILRSKANIVWVGLGSPKQDLISEKLSKLLPNVIFFNVGAAFRFLLGEYKMPNKLVQKLCLTGMYWRFLKKPVDFIRLYPKYTMFLVKLYFDERKKSKISKDT